MLPLASAHPVIRSRAHTTFCSVMAATLPSKERTEQSDSSSPALFPCPSIPCPSLSLAASAGSPTFPSTPTPGPEQPGGRGGQGLPAGAKPSRLSGASEVGARRSRRLPAAEPSAPDRLLPHPTVPGTHGADDAG